MVVVVVMVVTVKSQWYFSAAADVDAKLGMRQTLGRVVNTPRKT